MLPIRNISLMSPMCCNFCHKIRLGFSTPLTNKKYRIFSQLISKSCMPYPFFPIDGFPFPSVWHGLQWLHEAICHSHRLKMVPPSQFCSVLWKKGFCRNLKTNKVNYMKVYIFRKEFSQRILIVRFLYFWEIAKNWFFDPQIFDQG